MIVQLQFAEQIIYFEINKYSLFTSKCYKILDSIFFLLIYLYIFPRVKRNDKLFSEGVIEVN